MRHRVRRLVVKARAVRLWQRMSRYYGLKKRVLPSPEARVRLTMDGSRRLGHNCCAVCGRRAKCFACPACERVQYCSRHCASLDHHSAACSILGVTDDNDDDEKSSVVLDARILRNFPKGHIDRPWVASLVALNPKFSTLSLNELALLSYPLTLAWLLKELLPRRPKKILLLGASPAEAAVPAQAWADALRTVSSQSTIDLRLLGPELPLKRSDAKAKSGDLSLRLDYDDGNFKPHGNTYDLVVCLNPGLTCPDYDWSIFAQTWHQSTGLLALFAHSRGELLGDVLELHDYHAASLTVTQNPFHCPKWRQSHTMANDLYRKHQWCAILDNNATTTGAANDKKGNQPTNKKSKTR